MATTTTNFGWDIPQSTDLVKDGATAIAALGQDIDTALVDLKGGTTGQVLAKASGTDLDFSWVAQDDSNAIQNAIVDAKGDLIAATAADTPARLAVGTNGQVLTADSTTATGLKWATSSAAAGWTLLSTTSLSGSSVTVSSISTSYNELMISIEDYSTNTDSSLYYQLNADSGANLHNRYFFASKNTTIIGSNAASGSEVYWTHGVVDNTDNNNACIINIPAYANTSSRKMFTHNAEFQNGSGERELTFCNGSFNSTSAITSIKIGTTATWTQGTVKIYGC